MQIKIESRGDGYILQPTNQKACQAIDTYLKEWGFSEGAHEQYMYKWDFIEFADHLGLSQDDIENLNYGFEVVKNNIDAWTFLHVYGYDAHENVTW